MTKHINDRLSAFVDGELESAEAEKLISNILDNDELRSRWANYHLISHSMHANTTDAGIDLSVSVSAALANEPTVIAPRMHKRVLPAAFKQVAGMAIAASVAAAAVLMLQPQEQRLFQPSNLTASVDVPAQSVSQNILPVTVRGVNWSVAQPSVASKLNTYLVNHNGYSTTVRGALPFAPIVSYGDARSESTDESKVMEYNPNGSSIRR